MVEPQGQDVGPSQAAENAQDAEGVQQKMTAEEVEAEQKRVNEEIEQSRLNAEYEQEIKNLEKSSNPHISDLLDLSILKDEYKDNQFENCFAVLNEKYKSVRRARRDGNCFYRSFLFQLYEYIIAKQDTAMHEKLLKILEGSKEDLMINAGYEEIVIGDFFDAFIDEFKKLKDVKPEEASKHCLELLGNDEIANYLIMYVRWLTALYLKKNAILFEHYLFDYGDMETFCQREVEQLEVEAD